MMFICDVEDEFSAAHQLRGYEGPCEKLHGHNFRVRLSVTGGKLDTCGMLIDFKVLKRLLKDALAVLDHAFLNETAPFAERNPTSENLARFIADGVADGLPDGVRVREVSVWESPRARARYRPPAAADQ